MTSSFRLAALSVSLIALMPSAALACACGCGVFDVGTGTMLPTATGGTVWLEYDYMNQSQNWHGLSPSSSANNSDKQIRSDFFTLGSQYMFNRDWGAELEVPYTDRHFKTTDDDTGDLDHFDHAAFGDVKLQGIYSGFSGDMSTGVTFGLKLPSGDYMYPGFDRDTEIGTGSVNLLFGGYHMGAIDPKGMFSWFADALWDHPVLTQDSYRPGTETDAAVGSYYNGFVFDNGSKLSPILQLIGSYRLRDSGADSDPTDTGYKRLLISPGMEYDVNQMKFYGDLEFPIVQDMNGDQLTAPVLFKVMIGYSF